MSQQGSNETVQPAHTGDVAPRFVLRSQHGEQMSLADLRGSKSVVVVFYPFAFSGVCTGELCAIRDDLAKFQNDGVQVLAISCDAVQTLRAFAESQGYDFPLLSDFWPHGAVARAYGVFNDKVGVATRASFLIDPAGVIRWSVVHGLGEPRDMAGYHQALASA